MVSKKKQKKLIDLAINQFINPAFKYLRAEILVERVLPFLAKDHKIADIGCGSGHITNILSKKRKKVTAVDIIDITDKKLNLDVVLYDGKHLPFGNKIFDAALLMMVLHHDSDPIQILKEVNRVSKKIIIMEDLYDRPIDILFKIADGIQNRPPIPYLGSYKSYIQWIDLLEKHGFVILAKISYSDIPTQHGLFVIEEKSI